MLSPVEKAKRDALKPDAQSQPLETSELPYVTRDWGSTGYNRVESLSSSKRAQSFILHSSYGSHRAFFKLYYDKADYNRELQALKELSLASPFLWVPTNVITFTNEELEDTFGICPNQLKNYTPEGVYGFESRLAPETLTNLIEISDKGELCSLIDKAGFTIGEISTMILRDGFKKFDFQFRDSVWRAILRSAAEGIVQMHRNNLVHLDVKPSNIVVQFAAQDIKLLKADNFKRFFAYGKTSADAFGAVINFGSALKVGQKLPDDISYTIQYSHPDMDDLEAIADTYYDWFSFSIVVLEVLVLKNRLNSIFTVFDGDGKDLMATKEAYEMSKADSKRFPEDVGNRLKASPYKGVVDWACKVFAREGDPKNYGEEFIELMDREWYLGYALFHG